MTFRIFAAAVICGLLSAGSLALADSANPKMVGTSGSETSQQKQSQTQNKNQQKSGQNGNTQTDKNSTQDQKKPNDGYVRPPS